MKEYMVTMWENSDQDCLRELISFKTKEEALEWAMKDIEFYGVGSFQINQIDVDEEV
jgi:hypothetical protein